MAETETTTLPIACLLPTDARQVRGEDLAAHLFAAVERTEELADGYAFAFPPGGEWIARLGEFIAAEHACCPFFTFELVVTPAPAPIWLRLRGPEGVKEFIAQGFGVAAAQT